MWTDITVALYEAADGVKAIQVSDPKTANAAKLTENLFRDVNIALANEFALLFEELGVDTIEVINACASKYNFMPHYPGIGVGGPCVIGGELVFLTTERGLKVTKLSEFVDGLSKNGDSIYSKWGATEFFTPKRVAYKPNIKDIQLTPVERVITRLREMGARVEIYDSMFKGEEVFGLWTRSSLEAAVKGADCLVVGTAHDEFRNLDLRELAKLARMKAGFVDGRNVVSPASVVKAGFAFRGVGREP